MHDNIWFISTCWDLKSAALNSQARVGLLSLCFYHSSAGKVVPTISLFSVIIVIAVILIELEQLLKLNSCHCPWCEQAFVQVSDLGKTRPLKIPQLTGFSEQNKHGQTLLEMAEKYVNTYPTTVGGPGGWRAGSLPLSGRLGTCRNHYWWFSASDYPASASHRPPLLLWTPFF